MTNVFLHSDADGITAGYLYIISNLDADVRKINYPEIFGDATDFIDGDIMCDMRPNCSDIKGTVYDHHPDHAEDRAYQLFWDDKPSSIIVYDQFKDKLNDNNKWKVAIGAVGDAEPEKIPVEIWEEYPELLDMRSFVNERYGKVTVSDYPVYMLLSSPINSYCRIGEQEKAMQLLFMAKSPLDILYNRGAIKAKETINKEVSLIMDKAMIINYSHVIFMSYRSKYRIGGILGGKLQSTRKTTVVLNEHNKSGSMRGVLTNLILKKFKNAGIECGGHDVAAGFLFKDEYMINKIQNILREI
jgi:hypothetical protein